MQSINQTKPPAKKKYKFSASGKKFIHKNVLRLPDESAAL